MSMGRLRGFRAPAEYGPPGGAWQLSCYRVRRVPPATWSRTIERIHEACASLHCLSCGYRSIQLRLRLGFLRLELAAIEIEHEQADRRRQVTELARLVDAGDEIRQAGVARAGDLLERVPERVLQAHAGLVARNVDRALDHQGFHRACLRS